MNYADYNPKLDKALLDRLSKKRPLSSTVHVLAIFAGIAFAFALIYLVPSPLTYVAGFILVAVLQHHLLIIQHETLHFFLFNSRKLNDLLGSFVSYLIGFTMKYRKVHFSHHRTLGQAADPDIANYRTFPLSKRGLLWIVMINLSGLNAIRQFLSQSRLDDVTSTQGERDFDKEILGVVAVQSALLWLNYALGHWEFYFIFWLLPLVTLTKTLTNFRNLAEHVVRCEDRESDLAETRLRTIRCGLLERLVFAPMNFNYHAEHHLFLSVPYQNLPELHRHLVNAPEYRKFVDLRDGYVATVMKYTV